MKITKDEAYILYLAMEDFKFKDSGHNKNMFSACEELQGRLNDASDDQRRNGRTSQNSGTDIKKRFVSNYLKKTNK